MSLLPYHPYLFSPTFYLFPLTPILSLLLLPDTSKYAANHHLAAELAETAEPTMGAAVNIFRRSTYPGDDCTPAVIKAGNLVQFFMGAPILNTAADLGAAAHRMRLLLTNY